MRYAPPQIGSWGGIFGVKSVDPARLRFDIEAHLALFQKLLSLPRETVPQLSAEAARAALGEAARRLSLEFIVIESVVPTFVLLPRDGATPSVTVFGSWHSEAHPVFPGAVEGAERLALAASIGALEAALEAGAGPPAVVVAPAATQGSIPLADTLRKHRPSLQAPAAIWARISPTAPKRRRVFLGARGRVVLALRGEGGNPYPIRDRLIEQLREESYGPRPLDFELLRKLAEQSGGGPMEFLEETLDDPQSVAGSGEDRLRAALFEPRGHVIRPAVRHPDRPQAWIVVETAENVDADDAARKAAALAGSASIEVAEAFPWDRLNIHHPSVQAEIRTSKSAAEGAEIWPMAPWVTPSGLFTKMLGTPLAEWGVPLQAGAAIRFPTAEALAAMERELAELLLRAMGAFQTPETDS